MTLILRIAPNTQAYLFAKRDVAQDKFDVTKFRYNYGGAATFPDPWAYWKFTDEGSIGLDYTGNGHTMSWWDFIPPGYDEGEIAALYDGGAVRFDPVYGDGNPGSGWMQYETLAPLEVGTPFTYCWWFKVSGANNLYTQWFEKLKVNVGYFGVAPRVYVQTDSYQVVSDVVTQDEWHFLVVYYDGAVLKAELDGVQIGTDQSFNPIDSGSPYFGTSPGSSGCSIWFKEVGIWVGANALTADQRAQLWNGGAGWSPY